VTALLVAFGVLALLAFGCSAYVALLVPKAEHRRDGYRVLKLLLGTTGAIAVLVRLHEAGVI
jgi:hypothetical protein